MAEYWADIIYRYRLQSGGSGKNVNYIAYKDDDTPLEEKTIIYSADFVQQLEKKVAGITERELKYQKIISTSKPIKDEFGNVKRDKNGKPKTETTDGAEKLLDDALDETFKFFNLGVSSTDKVACVLYSKVLAIYFYYGKALIKNDSLLCIDEGQDISILQYDLMLRVNDNSVRFNIYGDINQRLPSNFNIDDWDTLLKYINAKKFVLNENYRNSEEIIQFYNQKLSMSNLSFGLKTKEVEKISHKTLIWKVLLNLILGNRTAIICNDCNFIPNDIKEFCSFNDLSATDKAHVLTVKQAKGLEYDTVFVYDDGMNKNERYIAYTRALSELYILE